MIPVIKMSTPGVELSEAFPELAILAMVFGACQIDTVPKQVDVNSQGKLVKRTTVACRAFFAAAQKFKARLHAVADHVEQQQRETRRQERLLFA